jgi:hypothetical protein
MAGAWFAYAAGMRGTAAVTTLGLVVAGALGVGCGGGTPSTPGVTGSGGAAGGGGTPPPAAPSHARMADPGLPVGRWVDRTPCRIPFSWPPALREGHAAFDVDRQRVVVVGTWSTRQEVWELDPGTGAWQDRTPCALPASWPTGGGPLGYDESRHKTVLFAAVSGDYETWEWDGQAGTWERQASTFPFPLGGDWVSGTTVLQYDPQRHTLVLPAWTLFDWDGAGAAWTQRWISPTGGAPLARTLAETRASFAYDSDRGVMMAFGGETNGYSQELWETDGVSWTNRTPSPLPAAWPTGRSDARFFYDPATRRTVLGAGYNPAMPPGNSIDDLWVFDTAAGSFTAAPAEPASWSPQAYAFATTAGGGRVLLFQSEGTLLLFGHVLSWNDGGAAAAPVTDLRPAHAPVLWPITSSAAAAYDVRRARVVMFGGDGDATTNATSSNLVEWNGADGTWQDRTPQPLPAAWPPSRRQHAMAADSRRGRVVIFGGQQLVPDSSVVPNGTTFGPTFSDYWEWDGAAGAFTQRTAAAAAADWPPASTTAALTYDEPRDRVVLAGAGGGDPWEWNPAAGTWTRPPSTGNGASLLYSSRPALTYDLQDATTFLVAGQIIGGGAAVGTWDPGARSWTGRWPMQVTDTGPSWGDGSGAVADPITGLVWLASGATVWSWDEGAGAWTDRSADAMAPAGGNGGSGNVLVFDEGRGTLVLLNPTMDPAFGIQVVHVWELAVP